MYVRMLCKDCNAAKKDEIYQVLGLLAQREQVQIEEKGEEVLIYACPEGTIHISEKEDTIVIEANTRHAGPGFHAFVVELCCDLQEEIEGKYDLMDDLDYVEDHHFERLVRLYEEEITYMKDVLLNNLDVRSMNYLYESTFILPLEKPGTIPTAIGSMDIKEFADLPEQELMDVFYVWNEWDKNARFYKNAALFTLAKEGVGAYTLMDEATIKRADEICDYIELAYQWNPDTPLPVDLYRELSQILGRPDQLRSPIAMEQEPMQYRCSDVYHVWESMKVVAHGASQRSIDPVNEALCLMAPYEREDQWDWLIQASEKDGILAKKEDLMAEDRIEYQDKKIRMTTYFDTCWTIEAMLQKGQQVLYFHCVCQQEKDLSYLKQCIKESGFMN